MRPGACPDPEGFRRRAWSTQYRFHKVGLRRRRPPSRQAIPGPCDMPVRPLPIRIHMSEIASSGHIQSSGLRHPHQSRVPLHHLPLLRPARLEKADQPLCSQFRIPPRLWFPNLRPKDDRFRRPPARRKGNHHCHQQDRLSHGISSIEVSLRKTSTSPQNSPTVTARFTPSAG